MHAPLLCQTRADCSNILTVQDPNPDDPLNKEAAEAFQQNRDSFERQVQHAIMRGTNIGRDYFPPCKA